MSVRIGPVDSATAVIGIDLARLMMERVSPIVQPAMADAAEDLVEFGFADEKCVVGGDRVAMVVGEVELTPLDILST